MHVIRITALTAVTALLMAASAHAAQPAVNNGSLNGTPDNNAVPSGWLIFEGTPDLMDALHNVGLADTQKFGAAPKASPDGGTWVGLGADVTYTERFGQVIKGLTVGQEYTVSWSAGNFGYDGGRNSYLGSNAIGVMLDGNLIGSGDKLAVGSNWYSQSVKFVATAVNEELSFKLATPEKAYMSIDGIALRASAVPESSSAALLMLGMGAMGMLIRHRRAS